MNSDSDDGAVFRFARFVSRIIVHDWPASKKYYFMCKSWLSADFGGSLDRTFMAASAIEATSFHNLVMINALRFDSFSLFTVAEADWQKLPSTFQHSRGDMSCYVFYSSVNKAQTSEHSSTCSVITYLHPSPTLFSVVIPLF